MAAEPIYLDHNATTPLLPEVRDAISECYRTPLLNPSSQHAFGRRAHRVLEDARERIAELLGVTPADRVIFTSGGTEANNLALAGLAGASGGPGHLIISAIEHPSIAAPAEALARTRWRVDRLGVDRSGVVLSDKLTELMAPDTRAVAVLFGHNETGVLQPIEQLAAVCNERGIPLHADAAQVVGKLPVDFQRLGVATMSLAAHKFHGPLGIGALVVRGDVPLQPQLFGGVQQAGLRPGTESVALVVGMLTALEAWTSEREARMARMSSLRDQLEAAILTAWPAAEVIGTDADRLPNTSNIAFIGLDRQALFMALDQAGVACSLGSACASGSSEPSPTLQAMGCSEAVFTSAVRFSVGATTTESHLAEATRRIIQVCNDLRRQKPGPNSPPAPPVEKANRVEFRVEK